MTRMNADTTEVDEDGYPQITQMDTDFTTTTTGLTNYIAAGLPVVL